MGSKTLEKPLTASVSLVIFTCENREHLVVNSYKSFKENCNYTFDKVILAIDGKMAPYIIDEINPDLVIYHNVRKGYVNSISKALKVIDTDYFFWLEDDWSFKKIIDLDLYLSFLIENKNWCQIHLSKLGPLSPDFKTIPLGNNLYQSVIGFTANPAICNTKHLQSAFSLLSETEKGDKLGFDGFENFLTRTFKKENILCVLADPVDHTPIIHEGYLESTPRNWHMTNSLDEKTKKHLLTFDKPSIFRRFFMTVKLLIAFFYLSIKQLYNDEAYEMCFRIIALSKNTGKSE